MNRKSETVQMLVKVRITYDTAQARKDAIKEARESLGCEIYAAGCEGTFSARSGRVVLHDANRAP